MLTFKMLKITNNEFIKFDLSDSDKNFIKK